MYFTPELRSELRSLTPLSLSLPSCPGLSQGDREAADGEADGRGEGDGEGGEGEGDGEGDGEGCDRVKLSTVLSLAFSAGVLSISSSPTSAWKIKYIFSCLSLYLADAKYK